MCLEEGKADLSNQQTRVSGQGRSRNLDAVNNDVYCASLSIGGMTCGSCVGTITKGLKELDFVSSVNIDLIHNSGLIELRGQQNLAKILEKIDDLGYEASLVKLDDGRAQQSQVERSVAIRVDGMFCRNCAPKIIIALEQLQHSMAKPPVSEGGQNDHSFTYKSYLNARTPYVQITYRPELEIGLTIRTFVNTINNIDQAFKASVQQAPSVEERSSALQARERRALLSRLVFAAVVAIPTLIIGVVFMSIVPRRNPMRVWFEESLWVGNVNRLEWALFIMTTPVMLFGADVFHRRATKEIWLLWRPESKTPLLRRLYRFGSMNLLISAATLVAYLSSVAVLIMDATSAPTGRHESSTTYFDTVTFLTFFILIGKYLEAYSKAKTGDAVDTLSKMRPSEALLMENGVHKVSVDLLEIGDVVQVPHGQSPPMDGVIEQSGTFLFNESSLTGESEPVKKLVGETVYTGTINASNATQVKITGLRGVSMLDQIVKVVRDGQSKRAPLERHADVLTGFFVPLISLLAVLTWLIWLILGQSGQLPPSWLYSSKGGWPFWSLEFAIAVFVVACPCGIGLAAPTALFVGGGLAAKHGILVRGGGEAFQEASRLNTIVLDKTGTLTEGQMKVVDFELTTTGIEKDLVLSIAKAMEETSTHPIATAITSYCRSSGTDIALEDIKENLGQGISARLTNKSASSSKIYEAILGNERMLEQMQQKQTQELTTKVASSPKALANTLSAKDDIYLQQILCRHQSSGYSTAIMALREVSSDADTYFRAAAVFALADPIRSEAPEVLQALRASGLQVHMCTGDNETTARVVASQLEIPMSNVRAGVLPQDKAAYLQELKQAYSSSTRRKIIAFVGDGTNDAPALAAADVSIALASGSDVAVTTSSFILLNSDLRTILTLTRLARRVFLRVKLNFLWAAVYNICLVPVAAGVFYWVGASQEHGGWRLSPVWASIAMAASSISVVLSSLALRLPEIRLAWRR